MAEPTPRAVASSFLLLSKCTYTNRSTSFMLFCPYLNVEHSQILLFAVLTKNLFSRLLRTSATAANFPDFETLLLRFDQKISSHALSPGPSGRESPSGACLRPQPVRAEQ